VSYLVKEVFLSLQGEGLQAGRRAVFVRFAGCNLWSGRTEDRHRGLGACALWCDTDFSPHDPPRGSTVPRAKRWEARDLADEVERCWAFEAQRDRFVVLTGGEPLMQADDDLRAALVDRGFLCAVETNGTLRTRVRWDWLCVSPKLQADGSMPDLMLQQADELKVVVPGVLRGEGWTSSRLRTVGEAGQWGAKLVQPQDPLPGLSTPDTRAQRAANLQRCVEWVKANPDWRLSMQMHKLAGLP